MPYLNSMFGFSYGYILAPTQNPAQHLEKICEKVAETAEIPKTAPKTQSSPNLCVNSSFSYVVLSTLLLSSRDLTEWSLVYHNTLSYQRFYDLHSIHYDHLEGLHQLI